MPGTDVLQDAQYGISLTVGIGTHAAMPAEVAESVRNAHIAARYRLVYGPGQTIRYESIAARVGQSPVYPDEEFRTVLSAFERGDSAEFERRLSVLFTACYSQSVQFGLSAVSHLLVELYRCLPPALQAEGDLVGVSTQLGECDHISQQMRIIRSFGLNAIEGRLSGAQPERYKDQFSVIMAYVAEHYTNPDLSITAIAEHAGLSANTVRMLFRENGLSPPQKRTTFRSCAWSAPAGCWRQPTFPPGRSASAWASWRAGTSIRCSKNIRARPRLSTGLPSPPVPA